MNLMLQGQVVEDSSFGLRREIGNLQAKIRELQDELNQARREKESALASVRNLQEVLAPLYRSLGGIFGEIAASGVSPDSPTAPQFDQRWDAWKEKLGRGTSPARVIDALLTHGPLNRNQLRQASEMGWSTLDAATSRLKNLSLIEKSGDRWNLKTT